MTDDILMDRGNQMRNHVKEYMIKYCVYIYLVFKAFDRDNDGQVSMLEWVVGLNTYLRGTLDEKIACKSYDKYENKNQLLIFGVYVFFFSCIQLLFT